MKWRVTVILLLLTLVYSLLGVESLNLADCKELALQHNLGIKAQEELQKSAILERKASFTDFLPSFQAVGNYTRISEPALFNLEDKFVEFMNGIEEFSAYLDNAHANDPNWGFVEDLYDPSNSPLYNLLTEMYDAGLLDESLEEEIGNEDNWIFSAGFTQPLFTGGKLLEKYQISESMERITGLELEKKKQEVLLETTRRYWMVIELEAKHELAAKYLETILGYEADIQNYLDEGIITENELLMVQVKRHEAELQLLKVENGVALVRMALNQIIGLELMDQLVLEDELPQSVVYNLQSDLKNRAINQRPELMILRESGKISESLANITKARYFPNILLTANYNYLNPNPANSLKSEFGDYWTVGVSAQFELFHFNQRGYAHKAAKHRTNAVNKQVEEAKELVILEISQLEFRLSECEVLVSMAETNVESATRNLEQTQDRFAEGLVTNSQVLEAQTQWLKAETEDIEARSEYVKLKAELDRAAGELH